MKIAIVALGASYTQYTDAVKLAGGRHALYDETWVVNSLGGVLRSVGDRRPYFNNTTAYAVALAIHEGAKDIALYGYDGAEVKIGPDYSVRLTPRDLPTAAEIEARYNAMHRG